jgi:hypothetical protein
MVRRLAAGAPDLEMQKARILAIADEVEKWLGLDWLEVKHFFNESNNDEDPDEMAHTVGKMQYLYGEITWQLYAVLQAEDLTLIKTMVHEYVHVMMAGIDKYLPLTKPYVTDANEFAVESVTRAIVRALRTPPPEALG